ncbi:DNA polymerase [Pseudoduganella lurida]|uniref:DNA polymerase n=1 Tax=Pseudoduganella lurida TaxID=1036180 RepID=A0A562RLL0_9BURK|nr:uracil-DNA glycosylase [Pseudoduganella lurida]TWI69938.1 DNA polymerase [Pseudoduganella lurida]
MNARNNVFLQEMGIGPRWLLRDRADDGVDAEVIAPEVIAAELVAVESVAVESVAVEAVAAAPVAEVSAARAPAPASVPAPSGSGDDTAWFDEAPAPPPRAPVHKVPAPARPRETTPAPSGEDTSWFDAVPASAVSRAPARSRGATDEEIAAMDWPALQEAVRRCDRCEQCADGRVNVPGRGDERARWVVLATAPTAADEKAGEPLSGEPGQLLDNMLRAVDLSTQNGVYVTTLVKFRPTAEDGSERLPSADELAACRPYLQRELALTGAGLVLTLGGVTAKGLLGVAARGKVLRHGELPVVATFHPADLLKQPADKARAWADLCLARSAHAGRR